jgi:hypothetical protein
MVLLLDKLDPFHLPRDKISRLLVPVPLIHETKKHEKDEKWCQIDKKSTLTHRNLQLVLDGGAHGKYSFH